MLDENRTVNVAVQVLPLAEDVYPIVDRAIAVIARSGVSYEVGPMETVMVSQYLLMLFQLMLMMLLFKL